MEIIFHFSKCGYKVRAELSLIREGQKRLFRWIFFFSYLAWLHQQLK